jgi:hypothetical protein
MAPSCALDEDGLRLQYERYRSVGRGARVLERSPRRLVVQLAPGVAGTLVEEALEVERACCPFFDLHWVQQDLRLTVSVSLAEHEPALEAIAFALSPQTGQSS